MNIERMIEAVTNRFQIKYERISVFISPDKNSAIVLVAPKPTEETATNNISMHSCNGEDWPFSEPCMPNQHFSQGVFQLYFKYFPGAFLDPRFVQIRAWDAINENWR